MNLADYARKRKFERTPEPAPASTAPAGRLRFVVHKHAARALHYDLRLELDGVLKSWSVPKGPSLDPAEKRLAVMVEDHPLEYQDFEGVIPEGNYGAGSVIIWDRGVYRHPSTIRAEESGVLLRNELRKGHLRLLLAGEKLRGEFDLVRIGNRGSSWLLMKKKDEEAGTRRILQENRSVASRKTLTDMLEEAPHKSFRRKKTQQIRIRESLETDDLRDAPVGEMPTEIKPMLATSAEKSFDDPDWIFEVKWDGYRALAGVRDEKVALVSRNGISFNRKYPSLVPALRNLRVNALLDGEIVAVDDRGRPDFQALQHYAERTGFHLLYEVFDLLWFDGRDLTGLPLLRRKAFLKKILPPSPLIRVSGHVATEGRSFFRAVQEQGLEGIVAKHGRSVYEPGTRSRAWLKIKARLTQDAVIGGFTRPKGSRARFGALVLGLFAGRDLVPIGHVGGGFSAGDLETIGERLARLTQEQSPFSRIPETNGPVTWVRPELVCEVVFAGWTADDRLRQPVFLRLREDKDATEAVRERS